METRAGCSQAGGAGAERPSHSAESAAGGHQGKDQCWCLELAIHTLRHLSLQEVLEVKTSELASQRIAFEEEKLSQQTSEVRVQDSEAEQLRHKLKEQVKCSLIPHTPYLILHTPYLISHTHTSYSIPHIPYPYLKPYAHIPYPIPHTPYLIPLWPTLCRC